MGLNMTGTKDNCRNFPNCVTGEACNPECENANLAVLLSACCGEPVEEYGFFGKSYACQGCGKPCDLAGHV